jgi:hypothetical protein
LLWSPSQKKDLKSKSNKKGEKKMSITLNQILALVGKLDDSPGEDTPRERFRRFLKDNINEVGQVRDYIEECLRISGDQYNRALQDLVNYLGCFLEFEVTFGRYHGVQGQIGFDGHWKSPTGFHIVVEVKTTEAYAIKTSALVGYVDELISEKKIPNWDNALGMYVVGRPDPEIRQLESAILAEKRTHQLRITSLESLLSLAEMMNEYDVSHQDILAVIRPSGPTIDPIIDLMARLVAQRQAEVLPEEEVLPQEPSIEGEVAYWLTPVKSDEEQTSEEVIQTLVAQEQIYAFGERTPGRKHLKPGDWICFYATGKGVIAHAKVLTKPEKKPHRKVRHPEIYPWVFSLENAELYLNEPIVIDATVRNQLDAFRDRDLNKSWAWFVQATRRISQHDFDILIRH